MKGFTVVIAIIALVLVGAFAAKKYHLFRKFNTQGINSFQNNSGTTPQTEATTAPTGASQNNQSPEPTSGNITLEITSPKDGDTLSSTTVTVTGKTVPNADVSVNDKDTKADASGNFSVTVTLEEGDDINVSANDKNGNFAEQSITVTLP